MDERLGQMNEQMGLLDKHLRHHAEESKSWHRVVYVGRLLQDSSRSQ